MEMNECFPVRVAELRNSDSYNPLMAIQFVAKDKTPETPSDYCTIQVDANGSSATKLLVTVRVGKANAGKTALSDAATTTYDLSYSGVVVNASATGVAVLTVGKLVDYINKLTGFTCRRLNCDADLSTNTDDFLDLAETAVGPLFQSLLYRDASEVLTWAVRIGVPTDVMGGPGRGKLCLMFARAYLDSASATDCVINISQDPDDAINDNKIELPFTRYVPDAAWTDLYDFEAAYPTLQGPILVEVTATSSLAAAGQVLVGWRSCEA